MKINIGQERYLKSFDILYERHFLSNSFRSTFIFSTFFLFRRFHSKSVENLFFIVVRDDSPTPVILLHEEITMIDLNIHM